MNYTKKDFERCLFNPFEKVSPRLKELSEDEKLLKYVVALYDPQSPLFKDYPELAIRKQTAALVAGYDVIIDNEYLESLYACNNDEETEVVINFLKIVQNRIWAMIVSIEQTIWEYNLRLLSPISKGESDKDKDLVSAVNMKSKMAEDLGIMNDRLDGYLKKFYGDDRLEEKAEVKQLRFNPQSIASVLKDKGR